MIAFHSRQSDCDWSARKNENTGTFNFTSQFASSIGTVAFTKREKSDASFFKSRRSRTVVYCRFSKVYALPLIFIRLSQRANRSPMIQRNPARRSRNISEPSGNKSGEMYRSLPQNFSEVGDDKKRNTTEHPHRLLERQLPILRASIQQRRCHSPSNKRCKIPQIIPQADSLEFRHDVLTMPRKNYEYITINTRSRIATKNCGGFSTRPKPYPVSYTQTIP